MSSRGGAEPDASAALDLIRESWIMTLGTTGENGPWTAPVYYLYEDRRFYFFSNLESRHIAEGENRTCAAAVFRDDPEVRNLRGLQMTGILSRIEAGTAAARIALAYGRRFRIHVDAASALDHFQQAFHAALYAFTPTLVFYMDNRNGFGNRRQISL